jgi:TPP-dependent pyruvate/acetoin dehydrogenase alpha subunit
LRDQADLSDQEEEELALDIKKLLNDAIKRAEEAPLPDPATVLEGVWASPEDLDTPHHK